MGPIRAVASCYRNILNFSGRARRAEYWWFALFQCLVGIGLQVALALYVVNDPALAALAANPDLAGIAAARGSWMVVVGLIAGYLMLVCLPQLAVTVRRLHDTDRSGWFIFMPFLAYVAALLAAVFIMLASGGQGALVAVVAVTVILVAGSLWFLVVLCLPGTHGMNRFGPDPAPDRKRRRPPAVHGAFAPRPSPEEHARLVVERRAEITDYYRKHVLQNAGNV